MSVKERIKIFIKNEDKSVSAFEKTILASNGYVNSIHKSIGIDKLEIILEKYPNLNIEWLFTGKGEMLKDALIVKEEELKYITNKKNNKSVPIKKELIPFYDVDFIAGELETFDNNAIVPEYYMDIPQFYGCTSFRAYSDSMEKLINSGSILFGKKIENWLDHLEYGQIYGIVAKDGRRYLKYIRRAAKEETNLLLRSENENYDDFDMPKKAVRSIWLIEGYINKRT